MSLFSLDENLFVICELLGSLIWDSRCVLPTVTIDFPENVIFSSSTKQTHIVISNFYLDLKTFSFYTRIVVCPIEKLSF